LKLRSLLVQAD